MANLITLEDYKLYKKLTKTESDEELTSLIASVSALVKSYCGHSFIDYYSTPKIEYFNIDALQHAILLNEWPIVNVASVESLEEYTGTYSTIPASTYFIDKGSDVLFYKNGYWPEGFGAVKVTYTAGYSSTPDDVKVAALDLVHHYVKEEYKERKSIGTASIDNSSAKIGTSKWPAHIARVLDMYRNV